MATLAERLREKIEARGPVTFRDWMEAALYDEREGYYRRPDLPRWGSSGDYRTSPERTPLFAATFARHFAALHERLGSPSRWTILEAGAGAGHFARAALETLARDHARAFAATRYVIDEVGEDSRARVEARLSDFTASLEFRRLDEFGEGGLGAGIIFSNELLDALPVHRVLRRAGRLLELFVGLDGAGAFTWIEREPSTPRLAEYFSEQGIELAEGQSAEVNLAAEEWVARAARALTRGFVITADYGAEATELYDPRLRPRGTLRAFRAHQFSDDPLRDPGLQDLTTTVNWTRIKKAGESAGLRALSLERQDQFLLRAGLLDQLERLSALAPDEPARARLRLAARDMILPGGMAESFQVLVQKKAVICGP
ncbi:MAG TPA: SAM-dependent methyltransferase [Pyrinomonadaceae bacterium]|nr:SAM-dependent methyltransferase [Pyrinomonadaceae bacterium]